MAIKWFYPYQAWEPLKTNPLGGHLYLAVLSKSPSGKQKVFPLLWLYLTRVYFGSTSINNSNISSFILCKSKIPAQYFHWHTRVCRANSEYICWCFTSHFLKLADGSKNISNTFALPTLCTKFTSHWQMFHSDSHFCEAIAPLWYPRFLLRCDILPHPYILF